MSMILRVAASSELLTKDYLDQLAKTQGLDPMTVRRLRTLANDLDLGSIEAFPASELPEYLLSRDAPEEDIEKLKRSKPSKPKQISFTDSWLDFSRVTGTSVVFQGALEYMPEAGVYVKGWAAAHKKLKPLAKTLFSSLVRKVQFREPRGSEDASWELGGVLALTVRRGRVPSVAVLASHMTHELGHGLEEKANVDQWQAPWGQPPFVSDYAESKPNIEDFAESFRVYVERPSELKKLSPAKFEALKKLV
jgi:hypothetical protein